MTWFCNPTTKRAYKVQRVIATRKVVVLEDGFGGTFREALERLTTHGYHQVKNKPRYAGETR